MHKKNNKVLMCLSGGVDSSVAAALLVEQGYHVTGAFMKQWSDSTELSGVCSWKEDRRDAMRVAAKLGIQLLTLDFEKEYKEWVMGYMFQEYEAGRTPNPDVMCNKYIKFGAWLERAKELGFNYLATGHYAQVGRQEEKGKKYALLQAIDDNKDQTYFLHQLNQEQLAHTLFPIGEYTKAEVRELAKKFDLPTANRGESMGICFVGEVPMKEFLEQKINQTPGKIVTSSGDVVGDHDGLSFYTIGQRHGLKQTGGDKPFFVVGKNFETNELIVGYEDDPLLFSTDIVLEDMHWISGEAPKGALTCQVRMRHRQKLQDVVVSKDGDNWKATFAEAQRAVTPGQFFVMYKDGVCLGGAIIA
jgi:tRNA-specific 2-thiouridylase